MPNKATSGPSRSACCPEAMLMVQIEPRNRSNCSMTGASLISSGRVPKKRKNFLLADTLPRRPFRADNRKQTQVGFAHHVEETDLSESPEILLFPCRPGESSSTLDLSL